MSFLAFLAIGCSHMLELWQTNIDKSEINHFQPISYKLPMRALSLSLLVCWPEFDTQYGLRNRMLDHLLAWVSDYLVQNLHMPAYQLGTPVLDNLFKK